MSSTERAGAAVEAARALLADAPSFPTAPRDDVIEVLGRVAELSRIVDTLQVRLAHEVEERSQGPTDEPLSLVLGARHPKEAIGRAFGIRPGRALDLLVMARAVSPSLGLTGATIPAKYPAVAAGLTEGELSFAQAHAILSTLEPAAARADLEQLALAEQKLVQHATDPAMPLPPEQLTVLARRCVALLDPDGMLPNDEKQRALRSLRMRQQPDGSWVTIIRSPAEDGSKLKAMTDAFSGPRVKVAFHDDRCAKGGCDGTDCDAEGSLDDRTREQKAHDALIAAVTAYAASADAPLAGGEPPVLTFVGTVEAYSAHVQGLTSTDCTLTIEHTGSLIPIQGIDQLLCFADTHQLIVDEDGHPLWLGRVKRLFTRAQKRALAKRDKGCRVPGCGMPVAWCETHHIVPWQLGGKTDIDNGILVCSYHHHEIHAGRLRVEKAGPRPGQWRIVAELQPARTRTAVLSFAGLQTPSESPRSLAAAAPASLAVKLPDFPARSGEPRSAIPAEPVAQDPVGQVERSIRPPRRHRRPSIVTERHLRALLERHGRAREHSARADALPRPGIVLRR
ncbi:HNH endonuclease signature motif containing protein [Agrococcus lahaulensis]|uniref:HNH endonuclease signature motif containing protein n=1 Tax=Agrococcus lahaulensis TaxID=341722 RepID=UPI000553ADA0|nr:HNH endonuclease signature motif containing protein [Agrococcus lahaulensis]